LKAFLVTNSLLLELGFKKSNRPIVDKFDIVIRLSIECKYCKKNLLNKGVNGRKRDINIIWIAISNKKTRRSGLKD
jgi:hypothetical protein